MTATMTRTGPMTFGQLSVWRDVEILPRSETDQPNLMRVVPLGNQVSLTALRAVLADLRIRHESLRTTYDVADPRRPLQVVHHPDTPGVELTEVRVAPDERAADVADRVGTELRRRPFDLTREPSWRAVAVLDHGCSPMVSHLVLVVHHIAVDAYALKLLGRDFQALLNGEPLAPADSPLDLADLQRSDRWQPRRESAARHLRELFTVAARTPPPVIDVAASPAATMVVVLRSRAALPAALATAADLKVPMPSVLLAAFCHAVHDLTGVDDLLVSTMCGNRQHAGTADLVSSMNQWAPLVTRRRPGQPYAEFVRQLHWDTLRSYRHGCYDADVRARTGQEIEATIGPVSPEFFFNYVELDAGPPGVGAPEWSIERRKTRYFGGPDFYLQVVREAAHLEILARTRWNVLDVPTLETFLTNMHTHLLRR